MTTEILYACWRDLQSTIPTCSELITSAALLDYIADMDLN